MNNFKISDLLVEPTIINNPTTRQEKIHKLLVTDKNGQALSGVWQLKNEYTERLKEQIFALQKKLGKKPINHPRMNGYHDTKIKPHGFKFTYGTMGQNWFSKLNYVGTNFDNEPYIKAFVVGRKRYVRVLVNHLDIFDMAKIIDYLNYMYNV
jgi:hypothetical protein